jgi:hypothetical protein
MTASLHDTLGNANPHYTMRQGRKLQLEKQPERQWKLARLLWLKLHGAKFFKLPGETCLSDSMMSALMTILHLYF